VTIEPAVLRYVEHHCAGMRDQVVACLAGKLPLDADDLPLHVLAEFTTSSSTQTYM
jgi:hypothetical protein